MDWPGLVGITLLVYAPMSYLLLRGGHRRRMWVGALCLSLFVLAPGLDGVVAEVAHRGATDALGAAVLAGWLAATAALGFRPLTTAGRYSSVITVVQLALLGIVSHLLADIVGTLNLARCCPASVVNRALDGVVTVELAPVAVTDAELDVVFLFVGSVLFLLSHGHARIHGPIEPAAADRERPARESATATREKPGAARGD